jgi:hypothetical protein
VISTHIIHRVDLGGFQCWLESGLGSTHNQRRFAGDFGELQREPGLEIVEDRFRFFLPQGNARVIPTAPASDSQGIPFRLKI